MKVTVAIIGAGSIGLLFAAYLRKKRVEVILYTRTKQQAKLLQSDGFYLTVHGEKAHYTVQASPLTREAVIEAQTIIVAVKQHHLAAVLSKVQKSFRSKDVLFIQNGMSHLSMLEELEGCNISLGVVDHGALKVADNKVIHTGIGKTSIAPYRSICNDQAAVIEVLQSDSFPVQMQRDWHEMLAQKLTVNAVINPLTALFRVKNGTLLTNKFWRRLMEHLFQETVTVLKVKDKQRLWDYVITVCKNTAENESSMYRDVVQKRKTEIDAINGYVLEQAQFAKKQVPYTEFVYYAMKGIERKNKRDDEKEGKQNAY